ncbi:MAG TPA: lipid A deacylase LpxR family protein [Planctomycetota bacterium]|nr:lipid A deacylase LpxR family protein [Planctomycetota bacterium]
MNRPGPRRAFPMLLAAALAAGGCAASGARFTFVEENDVFNIGEGLKTDRDRTQGLRLAATFPAKDTPGWARSVAGALPIFAKDAPVHVGVVVGQELCTPEDRTLAVPPPDDRPYAAVLYAGFALQAPALDPDADRRLDRRDTLELDLGVVGPSAHGEQAQNGAHELFDISLAQGWDTQLEDELAIQASWERRWRVLALGGSGDGGGVGFDTLPLLRARAGTVRVDASAGAVLRVGWNLPRDFGPTTIDSFGLEPGAKPPGFSASIWAGGEGAAVVHDVTLEGGVFRERNAVTEKPWTWLATAGVSVGFGPVTVAFIQNFTSPEFRENERYHQTGTILVSAAFWF